MLVVREEQEVERRPREEDGEGLALLFGGGCSMMKNEFIEKYST
jgi:hypothetical protein